MAHNTTNTDQSDADVSSDSLTDLEPTPVTETPGATEPVLIQDETPAPKPEPRPAATMSYAPPPAAPPPQVVVQKVGAWPLFLGGVLTAGLGFAVAWVLRDQLADTLTPEVSRLGERITALEAKPEPLPPDLTPLQTAISALDTRIGTEVTGLQSALDASAAPLTILNDNLTALDERLTAVERAPAADGSLTSVAIASWQSEIEQMQDALTEQQNQIAAFVAQVGATDTAALEARLAELTNAADAQLAAARAEAETLQATAARTTARAAMDRILASLDAGTAYDVPLGDLVAAGLTLPDVLTANAAGLPTLAALQDGFPDAARAALDVARTEGLADQGGNRFMSFLRGQFNVRSVTPQEGTDPDAVLSRAEAALGEGRLSDALAEVASLPEVVRAAMSGWTAQAEARAAALAAANALSETLAQN